MANLESIDQRRLAEQLVELMIRVLHYQQHGEPDWMAMSATQARELPEALIRRYRSEGIFHAQVQRSVAEIMHIVDRAPSYPGCGGDVQFPDGSKPGPLEGKAAPDPDEVGELRRCYACDGITNKKVHDCPAVKQ